jgi:hypothetical protein
VSPSIARAAWIAAALLVLSACSGSKRPQPPACPSALLLKGAERTAGYRSGVSADPADLDHLAVLTGLVSACRYDEGGAEVGLRFNLIAEQGPAYGGGPLWLTYFIATLTPDREVLSKPLFESEVVFPEGRLMAGHTEEMTVRLPNVRPADGAGYKVYVGFQLDDAEIDRRFEPAFR